MKNNAIIWISGAATAFLLLLLMGVSQTTTVVKPRPSSEEQINLALREVADKVLRQNQDFQSLIPPIQREADSSYLIKLGTTVNYADLRALVDSVLQRHHLLPNYRLSLVDCESGEIVLGFLAQAGDPDKGYTCQDREQDLQTDSYHLRLTFFDADPPATANSSREPRLPWMLLGLALGFPLFWLVWQKRQQAPISQPEVEGWVTKNQQTRFHPGNQQLTINDHTIDLTFREAKLLQFFFEHDNQVLERERILEAVWGDEGVIVGRSLDVFVSRLRKKLKADPELQIVSVHGVGYKLTVG